jgi:hypothetical protein
MVLLPTSVYYRRESSLMGYGKDWDNDQILDRTEQENFQSKYN